MHVLLFLSHSAIYMYTIDSLLSIVMIASTRAREKPPLYLYGNDDDVIINYITDMDLELGEATCTM